MTQETINIDLDTVPTDLSKFPEDVKKAFEMLYKSAVKPVEENKE